MTNLAEALAQGYEVPDAEEEREQWRINHDNQATWALRKLWWISKEADRIKRDAEEEIARIKQWQEDALRPLQGDTEFFEGKLAQYFEELAAAGKVDEKKPTYKLPAGTVARRKNPDSIELTDEAKLLAWAKAHKPGLVVTSESIAKSNLKAFERGGVLVDEDGSIIPGARIKVGEHRYDVKPANVALTTE